jgi:hypothetical protein
MLSEALTSLEDVKSRLQQNLLQQPEYRALLVVDQAMAQLAEFLGPFDLDAAAGPENRAKGPAAPNAAARQALESSSPPARDALDIARPKGSVAAASAHSAVPARAPSPVIPAAVRSERAMDAPPATPAIFRMAAVLRELAGVTLEAADAADRDAPAPVAAMEALNEPGEADPHAGHSRDYSADAGAGSADERASARQTPVPHAAIAGLPAASYESVGDAAEAPVSGIGALYMSIGDGVDDAPSEERVAQALSPAIAAFDEFADAESPPAEPASISGMAAILYETTGDAPDVALVEDGGADAPMESAVVAEEPVREPSGIERMIAKATQAAAPAAKAPTPRSYLPYIAAQRLVQSRRF